jgi:hypothetical protein
MNVIIISDLRALPVSSALALFCSLSGDRNRSEIWISSAKSSCADYGDHRLSKVRRYIRFTLLKLLGAKVIPTISSSAVIPVDELVGIRSSLISITNDHLATAERYPEIYNSLCQLHRGACEITRRLRICGCCSVYVFNGRLASTYAITKYCMQGFSTIFFYEYSSVKSKRIKYSLRRFSPHNFGLLSLELLEWYKSSLTPLPERLSHGSNYISCKLKNSFTNCYRHKTQIQYGAVIFLSSPHEYLSLDQSVTQASPIAVIDMILKAREILSAKANKIIAIRAHPNMIGDPSCNDWCEKMQKLAIKHNFDFIAPDSTLSSYDLIRTSDFVLVDISSIGLDCIFLGYSDKLVILGRPYYVDLVDYLDNLGLDDLSKANELAFACSRLGLAASHDVNFLFFVLLRLKVL